MAMVSCEECGNSASNKAAACPQCGAPIASAKETRSAGANLKTIQETSKKFKLQILGAVALMIISGMWFAFDAGLPADETSENLIPAYVFSAGMAWYLITKFRIWWHHK